MIIQYISIAFSLVFIFSILITRIYYGIENWDEYPDNIKNYVRSNTVMFCVLTTALLTMLIVYLYKISNTNKSSIFDEPISFSFVIISFLCIFITFGILVFPIFYNSDSINNCYPIKHDDCSEEVDSKLNYILIPDWIIFVFSILYLIGVSGTMF